MQIILDTYYKTDHALTAYVLFAAPDSRVPLRVGRVRTEDIQPYIPGEFHKRELPCILAALGEVVEPLDVIYIDANVWLGVGRPGLGWHVHEALGGGTPVVGISKSPFKGAEGVLREVRRPSSKRPLYISAIGIDPDAAADMVADMHGKYRLPDMARVADAICRGKPNPLEGK